MSAANEVRAYQRKEYLLKFLEQDVRPDNRGLGDTREAVSFKKNKNLLDMQQSLIHPLVLVTKMCFFSVCFSSFKVKALCVLS